MIPFLMTRHTRERDELVTLSNEEIAEISGGTLHDISFGVGTSCVSSTVTPNGDGSCCTTDQNDDP